MGRKSKEEMVIEIQHMVSIMKPFYKDANIKENTLQIKSKYINLPFDMIKQGYDWLVTVFNSEFDAIRQIKKLLPEDTWERYRLWGLMDDDNYAEVKLLKQRNKILHSIITSISKPDLYKRTKVNGYFREIRKAQKESKRHNKV